MAEALARTIEDAAPWWKPLSNFALVHSQAKDPANERVVAARQHVWNVENQLTKLEDLSTRLESDIKTARHARRRFDSAVRSSARQRESPDRRGQRREAFAERSRRASEDGYARDLFMIRKQDYKRGNPLDNHFRTGFLQAVLMAFHSQCLVCLSNHDLTLDHYAIPKNEGGNFVLPLADRSGIRMNVLVLCRACNSSKGETSYRLYLNPEQLQKAKVCQDALMESVLGDEKTLGVIRSWCGVRV